MFCPTACKLVSLCCIVSNGNNARTTHVVCGCPSSGCSGPLPRSKEMQVSRCAAWRAVSTVTVHRVYSASDKLLLTPDPLLHRRRLTCASPPAPGTTSPWRCVAARQSSTPHQSAPAAAGRPLCQRRRAGWRRGLLRGRTGRLQPAGGVQPCLRPPCWPVRWSETPGLP